MEKRRKSAYGRVRDLKNNERNGIQSYRNAYAGKKIGQQLLIVFCWYKNSLQRIGQHKETMRNLQKQVK